MSNTVYATNTDFSNISVTTNYGCYIVFIMFFDCRKLYIANRRGKHWRKLENERHRQATGILTRALDHIGCDVVAAFFLPAAAEAFKEWKRKTNQILKARGATGALGL